MRRASTSTPGTITLADLDPRRDVRGGAGKRLFGEVVSEVDEPTGADVEDEKPRPDAPRSRSKGKVFRKVEIHGTPRIRT